jgi:hypothetical protein
MKTLMIAVALVLSSSTTVLAQKETIFLGELTINSCQGDVCVNLTATLHPTESLLAYLVYDRLTGTPIIPPVTTFENLPTGALVINDKGTEATLVTDGIALTWQATGAVSTTSRGATVQRAFGRVVRRFSSDSSNEQAKVTGTLRGITVDHTGEIQTDRQTATTP